MEKTLEAFSGTTGMTSGQFKDIDNELEIGCYPNPFNSNTIIETNLNTGGFVSVIVYDILGQQVKKLLYSYMTPGRKKLTWNGIDDNHNSVNSGVYIVRLRSGENTISSKILLLK